MPPRPVEIAWRSPFSATTSMYPAAAHRTPSTVLCNRSFRTHRLDTEKSAISRALRTSRQRAASEQAETLKRQRPYCRRLAKYSSPDTPNKVAGELQSAIRVVNADLVISVYAQRSRAST